MAVGRFLARLRSFADFDERDDEAVLSLPWTSISVSRGKDVLHVGEQPDFVYVVESGWAARYAIRRDGSRRITGFMLPGDLCGIHAFVALPMEHAVTALTNCEIVRIKSKAIYAASAASPAIVRAMWRAKLADEAVLRMWLLNSRDAAQALAHLLCELHARADAIGEAEDGGFHLPATQEQIGDALGITAVHTNRMLRQLRTRGLVEVLNGRVAIPDVRALRAACGFSPSYLHLPARGTDHNPMP